MSERRRTETQREIRKLRETRETQKGSKGHSETLRERDSERLREKLQGTQKNSDRGSERLGDSERDVERLKETRPGPLPGTQRDSKSFRETRPRGSERLNGESQRDSEKLREPQRDSGSHWARLREKDSESTGKTPGDISRRKIRGL